MLFLSIWKLVLELGYSPLSSRPKHICLKVFSKICPAFGGPPDYDREQREKQKMWWLKKLI